MSIIRLTHDNTHATDSIISGRSPIKPEDPPGFMLGRHPELEYFPVCITYWEGVEIANMLGYPSAEVYEAQLAQIDEQAQQIADLQVALNESVNSLQLQAVAKEVRKGNKEILHALEATLGAVRARVSGAGSDAGDTRVVAPPAGRVGSTKKL